MASLTSIKSLVPSNSKYPALLPAVPTPAVPFSKEPVGVNDALAKLNTDVEPGHYLLNPGV